MKLRNQSCQLILGHYSLFTLSGWNFFLKAANFIPDGLGIKSQRNGILVPNSREYLERLYN